MYEINTSTYEINKKIYFTLRNFQFQPIYDRFFQYEAPDLNKNNMTMKLLYEIMLGIIKWLHIIKFYRLVRLRFISKCVRPTYSSL